MVVIVRICSVKPDSGEDQGRSQKIGRDASTWRASSGPICGRSASTIVSTATVGWASWRCVARILVRKTSLARQVDMLTLRSRCGRHLHLMNHLHDLSLSLIRSQNQNPNPYLSLKILHCVLLHHRNRLLLSSFQSNEGLLCRTALPTALLSIPPRTWRLDWRWTQ